jgi:hypothetical protein
LHKMTFSDPPFLCRPDFCTKTLPHSGRALHTLGTRGRLPAMQHVGRMGTLVGFAFQVGAAGAAVIAPDQKWIGWALCALGLLTFAATLA